MKMQNTLVHFDGSPPYINVNVEADGVWLVGTLGRYMEYKISTGRVCWAGFEGIPSAKLRCLQPQILGSFGQVSIAQKPTTIRYDLGLRGGEPWRFILPTPRHGGWWMRLGIDSILATGERRRQQPSTTTRGQSHHSAHSQLVITDGPILNPSQISSLTLHYARSLLTASAVQPLLARDHRSTLRRSAELHLGV